LACTSRKSRAFGAKRAPKALCSTNISITNPCTTCLRTPVVSGQGARRRDLKRRYFLSVGAIHGAVFRVFKPLFP
jgi:hypothetical protein